MKISSRGHYALLAIFDLAAQPTDEPIKIASIAKRQGIPQKFLELILASLKQGGFVKSHRGAVGGYQLARRPETITVGEVLRFIDGNPQKRKPTKDEAPFSELWRRVDQTIDAIVDNANFAAIVRDWLEKQQAYVHDWDI
jgi:Rrf2 family protein